MQDERIRLPSRRGDDELNPMRHEPADKINIAAQSIELCDQHSLQDFLVEDRRFRAAAIAAAN
jgi:hypothetical protein